MLELKACAATPSSVSFYKGKPLETQKDGMTCLSHRTGQDEDSWGHQGCQVPCRTQDVTHNQKN